MKFLLNMNVPRELGERLGIAGHSYRHVGDVGLAQASDGAIIAEATARGRGHRHARVGLWPPSWRSPAPPYPQA